MATPNPNVLMDLEARHIKFIVSAIINMTSGITLGLSMSLRAERALEFVNYAQKLGLNAPKESFEIIVFAFAIAKQLDRAESVVEMMRKQGYPTESDSILGALIRANIMARNDSVAIQLFDKLVSIDKSTKPYDRLLESYAARHDEAAVNALLEKMRREGPKPTAHTYELLTRRRVLQGNTAAAIALANELKQSGGKPSQKMFDTLIIACNIKKDFKGALAYLEEMNQSNVRFTSATYAQQIVALAGLKDRDAAWSLFATDVNSVKSID
eukprot:jgi/Hompol1/762/HPOL_003918-RA